MFDRIDDRLNVPDVELLRDKELSQTANRRDRKCATFSEASNGDGWRFLQTFRLPCSFSRWNRDMELFAGLTISGHRDYSTWCTVG
jgi:hypothetical protein